MALAPSPAARAGPPIGSVLFVPGSRPDRFASALGSDAGLVCIDLEDAVPPAEKDGARAAATAALGDARLAVRVNGLTTRAGIADLLALAAAPAPPTAILLPMVDHPREIAIVRGVLGAAIPVLPLVETAAGLRAAAEIGAADGVAAMLFGGGDLSAELGVALAWEPLLGARHAFVLACAIAGVPGIDVPWTILDDEAGLADEARRAKAMGFAGKAAIHPRQLPAIHAAFQPSADELAEAREALAAFDGGGGRPIRFHGRMLEVPVMQRYRRIVGAAGVGQDA